MSLGFRLRQTQRLAQSLRLSHEQRHQLAQRALSRRLGLIEALREERYEPKASCPRCDRKLTPLEIIRGFNRDPNDYTTGCSACGHRFEPKLICQGANFSLEIPFFCSSQTLAQLPGLETLPPDEFLRLHPAVYRSAIVHHGGIRKAFAQIGIVYPFEEIHDWKSKVEPFLGRVPDTMIAECADVSVSAVRRHRRSLGVRRYTIRAALAELS